MKICNLVRKLLKSPKVDITLDDTHRVLFYDENGKYYPQYLHNGNWYSYLDAYTDDAPIFIGFNTEEEAKVYLTRI